MGKINEVEILPSSTHSDWEWLKELWVLECGGETVISKGKEHHFQDHNAVIAWLDGARVGAATYRFNEDECELVSIHSTLEGLGIGSKLISAVEQAAKQFGINRIWIITTNDNVNALRFYQKRGYRLSAVYPDAVNAARKQKPSIPLIGNDNIPIQDELELKKDL